MIRAISLALIGAASFAAVYYAMAPEAPPASVEATAQPAGGSEAAAASAGADSTTAALRPDIPAQNAPEAPRPVRNVTPANLTAAPPVTGALVRVEPPKPPEPEKPARTERLFSPLIVAAGTIKVGERQIGLAGISATDPEATCGEDAEAWPCGRVARAALRSFIRGRAIECDVPAGSDEIPDPARCRIGGEDISEWLVAQGWAKRSGDVYEDAEKRAREAKLGLFSASRPDAQDEVATRR
jgi:endonuclease YncB( thermonuclease family)